MAKPKPRAYKGKSQADESTDSGSKQWIRGAISKPGALHSDLGVPQGEKIPVSKIQEAAKGSGKTAKRARLALTLRKMGG